MSEMNGGKQAMMKQNCFCASRQSEPCRSGCRNELDMLRALDFAIQETVLYLDAYPDCRAALEYYQGLIGQRKELLASYEKNCGPQTMYGNISGSSWDWIADPWPWEPEAN